MSEMSVGDAHMERCGAAWDAAERGTSPKGRGVQNTNLRTQYSILRTFINISQQLFIFTNVRMSDVCIAGNCCKNRIYMYIYIYIHTYMYTYVCILYSLYIHLYIHICIYSIYTSILIYIG